uniref:protein phosphatase 1 regulatory subunit 14B n=1 Tax=Callithrix jacchus TaxID=9483 RepID=UPI0023DD196F|nr:protein phosphatase 1 regulatory subunit 14B [Callithrix jacchus]
MHHKGGYFKGTFKNIGVFWKRSPNTRGASTPQVSRLLTALQKEFQDKSEYNESRIYYKAKNKNKPEQNKTKRSASLLKKDRRGTKGGQVGGKGEGRCRARPGDAPRLASVSQPSPAAAARGRPCRSRRRGADDEGPVRHQGKVTVKIDCKELRKSLRKEGILYQLTRLYDCQEEKILELEIDVDELLCLESDDAWAARVEELRGDCYKHTEAFISGLLDKIRGMQKLSAPQKK